MNYWHRRSLQTKLETEGSEYVHPAYPEWKFWLRRAADWAPDYERAVVRISTRPDVAAYLKRVQAPNYETTDADRKLDVAMQRDVFAEGCVAKWEGVTDGNGEPMDCTPKNARAVMRHFPDIYADALAWARNPEHYAPLPTAEKEAIAEGNS